MVFAPGDLEFGSCGQKSFQARFSQSDGFEMETDFGFIAVRLFDALPIDGVIIDGFKIMENIRGELI